MTTPAYWMRIYNSPEWRDYARGEAAGRSHVRVWGADQAHRVAREHDETSQYGKGFRRGMEDAIRDAR